MYILEKYGTVLANGYSRIEPFYGIGLPKLGFPQFKTIGKSFANVPS